MFTIQSRGLKSGSYYSLFILDSDGSSGAHEIDILFLITADVNESRSEIRLFYDGSHPSMTSLINSSSFEILDIQSSSLIFYEGEDVNVIVEALDMDGLRIDDPDSSQVVVTLFEPESMNEVICEEDSKFSSLSHQIEFNCPSSSRIYQISTLNVTINNYLVYSHPINFTCGEGSLKLDSSNSSGSCVCPPGEFLNGLNCEICDSSSFKNFICSILLKNDCVLFGDFVIEFFAYFFTKIS